IRARLLRAVARRGRRLRVPPPAARLPRHLLPVRSLPLHGARRRLWFPRSSGFLRKLPHLASWLPSSPRWRPLPLPTCLRRAGDGVRCPSGRGKGGRGEGGA
ncbi:unnamed protein product, partial [Laminaria digitata]